MGLCKRTSRDGFTLVELLVVVAVIALLIAIGLPSLARAREQARLAVCMNRMHVLQTALASFANENHGQLPPFAIAAPGVDWVRSQHWGGCNADFDQNLRTSTRTMGLRRLVEQGHAGAGATQCPSGADEPGWFAEGEFHTSYALRAPYSEDLFARCRPLLTRAGSLAGAFSIAAGGEQVRVGGWTYRVPQARTDGRYASAATAAGSSYTSDFARGAWISDGVWGRGEGDDDRDWSHGRVVHVGWAGGAVTRVVDDGSIRRWTFAADEAPRADGDAFGAFSEQIWRELDAHRP